MDFSQSEAPSSRRFLGIGVAVLLHILIGYALISGLAREVIKVINNPIETRLIEEVKLEPPPPPPPEKQTPQPQPQQSQPTPTIVPKVEVPVEVSTSAPTITAVASNNPPSPVVESKPSVPVIVPPVVNASSCKKPVYPAASRRDEEEGTVILEFLVDVDGSVIQSKIKTSSGFNRLDEAARGALSQCAFKPGTSDGKPHQAVASMKYTWRLE